MIGAAVTLSGTGAATVTTGASSNVAQAYQRIVDGHVDTSWLSNSPPNGTTPPDPGVFYGTFGADVSTPTRGLFGFVNQLQLGPGLTRGFAVDAISPTPTLTLGLDSLWPPASRVTFP